MDGVGANGVAKWTGFSWATVGGGVGDVPEVSALASFDDGAGQALFAGGMFTTAGGVLSVNLGRWGWEIPAADGSGIIGVYVDPEGLDVPSLGSCVAVTGISSCQYYGAQLVNVLRPRAQSDIVVIASAPVPACMEEETPADLRHTGRRN